MSRVTVCMLTYNRLDYAKITWESVLKNLKCKYPLQFHIADNNSTEGYIAELYSIAKKYTDRLTISLATTPSYGANYNLAMQTVHSISDVVLPLEDDWELVREFDITPLVDVLTSQSIIGCIRLGYLGWTQILQGKLFRWNSTQFLLLDPKSPEPHIFSGHPRLESVEWSRTVGPWPEGLAAGETEFLVSQRQVARKCVAWPLDHVKTYGDLFAHIGTVKA